MSVTIKALYFIKKTIIFMLFPVCFILFISGSLLFTHSGNQLLINFAKKIEPRFSIELEQGSLFNSPRYSHISWIDESLNMHIESASYLLDWSCLFNKVCIKEFNISNAKIVVSNRVQPVTDKEVGTTENAFELPIAVDIKGINLQKIYLQVDDLRIDLDSLDLQVVGYKKEIALKTVIDGLLISLPDSKVNSIVSKKTHKQPSPESFPAILLQHHLPEIRLPINLVVDPIELHHFTLKQGAKKLFELNSLTSQFTLIGPSLTIRSFEMDLPEADFKLNGDIALIGKYPLNMRIKGKVKEIEALQPVQLLSGQLFDIKSSGDLSKLKTELLLSNKLSLRLTAVVDLFTENLPYTVALDWQQIRWPLTGKVQYLSTNGALQSSGNLTDYRIDFSTQYALQNIPKGSLSLKAKGGLEQLNLQYLRVKTLDGSVNLSGLLSWPETIKWRGQLAVDKIDLAQLNTQYTGNFSGLIKQNVAVTLNPKNSPSWSFTVPELDLRGQFLAHPFAMRGAVTGDSQQGIFFKRVIVNNAENKVLINGRLAQQNDLNIKIQIADLSELIIGSGGKISAEVNLQGPNEAMQIKSTLQGERLSYQGNKLNTVKLSGVAIAARKPKLTLQLTADNLTVADNKIDHVDIKIENVRSSNQTEAHQINLSVVSEPISSDLTIQLIQENEKWLGALSAARLYFPDQQLTLINPIDASIKNNSVQLTPHCWQSSDNQNDGNGKLCFKKVDIGERGELIFDIDSYLLSSLNLFLPNELKIAGAISANGQIKWFKTAKPQFDISVFSKNMEIKANLAKTKRGLVIYPVETFNIKLTSNDKMGNLSATIYSENLINTNIEGQIFPYKKVPTVNGSAHLELADFSAFTLLIPEIEKLTGHLQSELTITGPLTNPFINGQINIQDSAITTFDSPLEINRLNAVITLVNRSAKVQGHFYTGQSVLQSKEESKQDGLIGGALNLLDSSLAAVGSTIKKGVKIINHALPTENEQLPSRATINGQFSWINKLTGEIHLFADNIVLSDYDKIDLLVSPDLHLLIADEIALNGKIKVNKGKITVKELPEGAVSVSKDIIVIDADVPKKTASLPIKINLNVELGERLKVEALGLNTTVTGNLLIRKAGSKDLTIHGELNLVEGSYRALSQQLVLQKSRIIFNGLPDSPYLSIEAIRDPNKIEDNVTAGVRVTGTPDELSLVIFSDPAMAQQDALSYIMRGKSLQASSDNIGNSQIASMLINLGADKSAGVMNDLGNQLGIKDLGLTSSGSGDDQSVGVSGSIAPGVELSYGVGVFDGFTVLAIRYEIFKRFYIEASSGLDQAIDAYYEFDWD
jgi:translocation and assembly module TamB